MVVFQPGKTVKTDEPTVLVEVRGDPPLLPGRHRFQLVVVDDDGNESEPVTVEVTVRE